MASMKGSKPKHHAKGKIRHMLVKAASNPGTFVSEISRHHTPGDYMERDDPPTAHPSISHLTKHIKSTFAPGGPDEQDGNEYAEQTPASNAGKASPVK